MLQSNDSIGELVSYDIHQSCSDELTG